MVRSAPPEGKDKAPASTSDLPSSEDAPTQAPTLRGRHVVLEPLRPEHADALWPLADDPSIWRYLITPVTSKVDLEAWVAERLRLRSRGKALPFLQRDASGTAVGSTSLFDHDPRARRIELGFTWLGAPFRGTAINKEAKLLLLSYCFEELRVNRVQMKCDARNSHSRHAMASIGATFEGILRAHSVLPDGHLRDVAMFSVIRPEWPTVRRSLQERVAAAPTRTGRDEEG